MAKKKDETPIEVEEERSESEVSLSEKKDDTFENVAAKAPKEEVQISASKGHGGSYQQIGGGVRVPASK